MVDETTRRQKKQEAEEEYCSTMICSLLLLHPGRVCVVMVALGARLVLSSLISPQCDVRLNQIRLRFSHSSGPVRSSLVAAAAVVAVVRRAS